MLFRSLIDLDAIAHNTRVLAQASRAAELMAVVKADGFGHGAGPVARAALRSGATWLGVTSGAEAMALRGEGVTAPVLIWLYPPDEDLTAVVRAGVDISVPSPAHLRAVAGAARRGRRRAKVHLKVDTGLSRSGATLEDWPELVRRARRLERAGVVSVRGLWSHLANAERIDDPGVDRQLARFLAAGAQAVAAGLDPAVRHLANSAALFQHPRTHFDVTRAGIGLYGLEPVPGRSFGLRPAMSLRAEVVFTKRVPAGAEVSYGYDYQTDRATTLALLPLGFADGVPRQVTGQGEVLIRGVRCRIAGRIAMDQIVVDAGDLEVASGDIAVLFGSGGDGEPTVEDWARWAGTNPHEILTGIGTRVPRRYRESGEERVAA